ncbi:MAG: DNA topoisomerase IV subunit B, partial [Bacteroidetes bacterium QS_3_64_15]
MPTTYTGEDIDVLEGLEPVRKRPGMYIGGTGRPGLHHILWEVVDNAVDEATNGYASTIEVVLHEDGESVTVSDNGRGIPVDDHPEKEIPTVQLILTTLHSGGKFDASNYITSGGLHGVGVSVVNALSEELVATVKRDGKEYQQRFRRGTPVTGLEVTKESTRGTGSEISFRPDADIFESVEFDPDWIREHLDVKTYLNRELKIIFRDETNGERHELYHEGGIQEYLSHLVEDLQVNPIHDEVFMMEDEDLDEEGRLEIALQWTDAPKEQLHTFVNGIPTEDGGTHEQGLKSGIRSVVRSYMDTHDLVPHQLDIKGDDTREGLVAIVNLFMVDPQFQGQTKDKLNNPSARSLVSGSLRTELEQYLNDHSSTGEAIASRVVQAAKARRARRSASGGSGGRSGSKNRL